MKQFASSDIRILMHLFHKDHASAQEIAKSLKYTTRTVYNSLGRLIENDVVVKEDTRFSLRECMCDPARYEKLGNALLEMIMDISDELPVGEYSSENPPVAIVVAMLYIVGETILKEK